LQFIKAAVQGNTITNREIDDDFVRIAKEQTFLPMLWSVFRKKEFIKYYIQSSLIHEKYNRLGSSIDILFNKNKIPHIFLKGYELQNLYNDSNLRMLGDIDIYVSQLDFDKCIYLLQNDGFSLGSVGPLHTELTKNGVLIEIHSHLFEDFRIVQSYFSEPFDNSNLLYDFRFQLKDEYNFIIDGINKTVDAVYTYNNSVLGILEAVSKDYSNLDFDATQIQKKMADPENLKLVRDVLTKLG